MSIVVELLEPALVRSVADLKLLDLAQVRYVAIKLTSDHQGANQEPLCLESRAGEQGEAMALLVEFAKNTQPNGTLVEVWYQGRSETFSF